MAEDAWWNHHPTSAPDLTTAVPPKPDLSGPVVIDLGDGERIVGYLDREPVPEDHDGITFTYTFTS